MFNLEQAITEWRQRMLAAGLRSPVPLDELESHLRDEIERQVRAGAPAAAAFQSAAVGIGRAGSLQMEFKQAGGFIGWLGESKTVRINRLLAVLWLAGSWWSFITMFRLTGLFIFMGVSSGAAPVLMNGLLTFFYLAGMVGSISLYRGAKWGRIIIQIMALLMALACLAQMLSFKLPAAWSGWCGMVAIFSLITLWLLRPTHNAKLMVK